MNEAYQKGIRAYADYNYTGALTKTQNPYTENSEDFAQWNAGYQSESDSHSCSLRREQHNYHEGRFSSY